MTVFVDPAVYKKSPTPEQMWDNFIKRLNETQPLRGEKKTDAPLPHKNLLGSIESYEKIFIAANQPTNAQWPMKEIK